MAELQQQERLQPALLDRLTDDYPQKRKIKLEALSADSTADGKKPGSPENTDIGSDGYKDSNKAVEAGTNPQSPTASISSPGVTSPAPDQSDRLVITARKLRDIVKRDLSWLMNTGNLEAVQDLDDYPLVKESVLNYGVPDLTGAGIDNININELERRLHRILVRYEPRILRRTLKVAISKSAEMSRNALRFDIECDIWGQPAPEHIHLNSELDLELGSFKFTEADLG